MVNLIYKELLQNSTEDEMKKWAKQICTILPGSYASEVSVFSYVWNNLLCSFLTLVVVSIWGGEGMVD